MTQERLRTDPSFRRTVMLAICVRASRLWPLSRLLFMLPGLEEIHCFRHDCWVVTTAGQKALLVNTGNPFASDEEVVAFFRASRANILIAGGTVTGKTTLMCFLVGMIFDHETVVVIEDSAELHLESDRGDGPLDPQTGQRAVRPWVPFSINLCTVPSVLRQDSGLTMRELVRSALRFRPERILLGEARGAEMADVCTAMSTGHDGSMVTIHADNAFLAVERAASYVMESPRFSSNSASYDLAKRAVHQAIDVVVHLTHGAAGARRVSGVVAPGEAGGPAIEGYGLAPEGHPRRVCRLTGHPPPPLPARPRPPLGGAAAAPPRSAPPPGGAPP